MGLFVLLNVLICATHIFPTHYKEHYQRACTSFDVQIGSNRSYHLQCRDCMKLKVFVLRVG